VFEILDGLGKGWLIDEDQGLRDFLKPGAARQTWGNKVATDSSSNGAILS